MKKFLQALQGLLVFGVSQHPELRLYPEMVRPDQIVDEAVGAFDLTRLYHFTAGSRFIRYQGRGRGFQTKIEKGLEFFQGAGAVPPADQERPDLGVVKQIPEQFPQAIAIQGAEDGDGGSLGTEINPGQTETLHDILYF